MCGRYYIPPARMLESAFVGAQFQWDSFLLNYNVAPTQSVPVIRPGSPAPIGTMMRWGLIPFFARGVPGKYSTINATLERLTSGPLWRGCWTRGQRALMVAGGFYEWHLNAAGEKHPYFIYLPERPVFAFAAVWDHSESAAGEGIDSCAVITLPGNTLMRDIHNAGAHPHRMPAILREEDYSTWLGGSAAQAWDLLKPYPTELMQAYRVSRRVNSPRNNDEDLIEPIDRQIWGGTDPAAPVSLPRAMLEKGEGESA